MGDILKKLAGDFLSTIIFVAITLVTGNVLLATAVAIAGAIAQVIHTRVTGRILSAMTWASLALVIVLGTATFLTKDPRFVLMKPSIAHFAIGAIMLRRGWMSRYMPPLVLEHAPDLPVIAGYGWAVLMFALGAGTIGVALTGNVKLWAIYVSAIAGGAKVVAFAIQYVTFRIIIGRRIARQRAAAGATGALAVE